MTNSKEKEESEHISQESENNTIDIDINYDGNKWIKYKTDYFKQQQIIKNDSNVIFPLESKLWIWDYKLLEQNKTIIVDSEEYKIIGFTWQCYDGIMKNGSSITLQKII